MLIGLVSDNLSGKKDNLDINYEQISYRHDIEDLMTFDALIIDMESVLNNLKNHMSKNYISTQFTRNLVELKTCKRPVMIIMPNNNPTRFCAHPEISDLYYDIVDYLNFLYPNVGVRHKKYTQFNDEQFDMRNINVRTTYYTFDNLISMGSARKTKEIVYGFSSEYNVLFVPYVNHHRIIFGLFSNLNQKKQIEQTPTWIKDIFILNEKEINHNIKINSEKISDLKLEVADLEKELFYYSEIKSILYSSGEYLQEIIMRIFKNEFNFEILTTDIKNEEDIIIKHDNRYLVIEVKGTKGSITSSHIMQASKWKTEFILKNVDVEPDIDTRTKAVLIGNPMKEIPIESRVDEFPENTIRIALSNDVAIISTKTLLSLLEDIKLKKLSKEQIFNVLYNEKALIEYNKFSA